jgi:hypothetical protein
MENKLLVAKLKKPILLFFTFYALLQYLGGWMRKQFITLSTFFFWGVLLLTAQGCKWQDDFRARDQTQYLPQPVRPTLNPDSIDYEGDDTNKTEDDEKATALPDIDGLSTIPEVPEHPAGATRN